MQRLQKEAAVRFALVEEFLPWRGPLRALGALSLDLRSRCTHTFAGLKSDN